MSPIILALKSLYVALGGKLTDYYAGIAGGIPVSEMVLTADLIACLSKLSIGIELPAVTAEDDGDVLTVVSGKWAKAAGGGGGKTLYSHNIKLAFSGDNLGSSHLFVTIVNDSETAFTHSTLMSYVHEVGNALGVSGYTADGGLLSKIYTNSGGTKLYAAKNDITEDEISSDATVTDTVVEI